MPSPSHESYRNSVLSFFRAHRHEPDIASCLEQNKEAALVLWELDLEPARSILNSCYAPNPRGGKPRDPLVMLRCLLLSVLVGVASLNQWVEHLKGSRTLCVLAGLGPDDWPGVGTVYDFLHRLHDGPQRIRCEHAEQPSKQERRRSREPKKRKSKPRKKKLSKAEKMARKKRRQRQPVTADTAIEVGATERLIAELEPKEGQANPSDLLGRLSELLLELAVVESAQRGLLGDVSRLVISGDGSPLYTGGSGAGKRVCDHKRQEHCQCERIYSDPDAQWGWDSYRECYFFGHHFHEYVVPSEGHDLPLSLVLGPGSETDHTASVRNLDRLRKNLQRLPEDWGIGTLIHDCGADSGPFHHYLLERGIKPVIPLQKKAPAEHPQRPGLALSSRAVPLCEAAVEMTSWGSAQGGRRKQFVCPVKAGKLESCPLAPEDEEHWLCQPNTRWGPVISLSVAQNPRLCPPIARNSPQYEELYRLRTGSERSNSVKKGPMKLEQARHRRASFWLIRLHLCAILQHARAWVRDKDASALLDELLGPEPKAQAA